LDTLVVIPNHIEGILVVYENPVGTRHAVSLQEQFGKPTRGTIPMIIHLPREIVERFIEEFAGMKFSNGNCAEA
jgi:hypothetical protein